MHSYEDIHVCTTVCARERTPETLEKMDVVKKMKQRSAEMRENLPKNQ